MFSHSVDISRRPVNMPVSGSTKAACSRRGSSISAAYARTQTQPGVRDPQSGSRFDLESSELTIEGL
jgi:hypothetical protein